MQIMSSMARARTWLHRVCECRAYRLLSPIASKHRDLWLSTIFTFIFMQAVSKSTSSTVVLLQRNPTCLSCTHRWHVDSRFINKLCLQWYQWLLRECSQNGLEILNIQMCICELTVLSLVDSCVETKHNPSSAFLSLVTPFSFSKKECST